METPMSIKSKIATLAIAALALTAVTTASFAKPKIDPVTGLLIGAAVVGTTAAIAASQPHYIHRPRPHCWLETRQNMWTGQIFYVRQCHRHY
jgi:hypothetical protein